jgi:hypothetical protein
MVMYAVANYRLKISEEFSFFTHRIKDIKLLKTGLVCYLFIKCPINILISAK